MTARAGRNRLGRGAGSRRSPKGAPSRRRRRKWLFGTLALGVVAAGLWLLRGPGGEAPLDTAPAVALPSAGLEPPAPAKPSDGVAPETAAAHEPPYDGELRPAEVLGNLECEMVSGRGAANDAALVVLPHGAGAKFSVVDRDGAVAGGVVPFRPNRYELGRRADGTPLVGLGALRLNSKRFRQPDSSEPVRIYLGGKLIYESNKAWNFLIAPDASSFVVQEPGGAGASRLVVRDLELGEESHIDLGTRGTPANAYEGGYSMYYAAGGKEIAMYLPAGADARGKGTYRFYPVGEGRPQRVVVEDVFSVLVASSREAYFATRDEARRFWRVSKRRIDAGKVTDEELWHSVLDLRSFGGTLSVSGDGRWLGVHGWNFHVLNTRGGESVFEYPVVGAADRQLAMLSNVLGPDAAPDDIGSLIGIDFGDNVLRFHRIFGSAKCSTPPGEKYDALRYRRCVRDHRERGSFKAVRDVYDLDTLTADSQPMYREEVFRETSCMKGDVPFRGLQNVDGKLTYLPKTGQRLD